VDVSGGGVRFSSDGGCLRLSCAGGSDRTPRGALRSIFRASERAARAMGRGGVSISRGSSNVKSVSDSSQARRVVVLGVVDGLFLDGSQRFGVVFLV
jgi:hypothetical protein